MNMLSFDNGPRAAKISASGVGLCVGHVTFFRVLQWRSFRKKTSNNNIRRAGKLFEMQPGHNKVQIRVQLATLSLQCLDGLCSGEQPNGRDVSHVQRSAAIASAGRNIVAL
jgi:hypothetical protein